MRFLRHIAATLNQSMQKSLSHSQHQLVAVGAIAFFGFPLFYWIWTSLFPQPYETFFFRMIGSFLGLGLMLTAHWPEKLKPYLSWYWFITILYTLSFFFAYTFFMNGANTIASMSMLCSVFLLVLLVDLYSLTVLLVLGWGLAYLMYDFMTVNTYFGQEHLQMMVVILFIIIAGSTFNYKTAQLQEQRLEGMAAVAGMIAHELRTPLLGIRSGASAIDKYFPALIDGYQKAKAHQLIDSSHREARVLQLDAVSSRIISEIDYANTIIDMLLIKSGRDNILSDCTLSLCSMAECLNVAISRYPFKSLKERESVHVKGDFIFKGNMLLMQHVLFNLLKNALYAIAKAEKGDIYIWAEEAEKYHILQFKDTGTGMGKPELSRLFHHFHTTTFMGTGLGLSFCKMVMNRFGGEIVCESKKGQFTQFSLLFPK